MAFHVRAHASDAAANLTLGELAIAKNVFFLTCFVSHGAFVSFRGVREIARVMTS